MIKLCVQIADSGQLNKRFVFIEITNKEAFGAIMKQGINNKIAFTGDIKFARWVYRENVSQYFTRAEQRPFPIEQSVDEFVSDMPKSVKKKMLEGIEHLKEQTKNLDITLVVARFYNRVELLQRRNGAGELISPVFKFEKPQIAIENMKNATVIADIATRKPQLIVPNLFNK